MLYGELQPCSGWCASQWHPPDVPGARPGGLGRYTWTPECAEGSARPPTNAVKSYVLRTAMVEALERGYVV